MNNRIALSRGSGYYLFHEAADTFVPNPFGTTQRGGLGNIIGMARMDDLIVFSGAWTRSLHPAGAQNVAAFDLANGGWVDLAPGTSSTNMTLSMEVGSSGDKVFIGGNNGLGRQIDGVTFNFGAYYDGSWHAWDLVDADGRNNVFIECADTVFGGEVITLSPFDSPTSSPMTATASTISSPWNMATPGDFYVGTRLTRATLVGSDAYLSGGPYVYEDGGGMAVTSGVLRSVGGTLPDMYFTDAPDANLATNTISPWTRPALHSGSIVVGIGRAVTSTYRTGSGTDSGAVSDRVFWLDPSTGLVTSSSTYPDAYLNDLISYGGELYALGAFAPSGTVNTTRVRRWNSGTSSWDLVFQAPNGQIHYSFRIVDTTI